MADQPQFQQTVTAGFYPLRALSLAAELKILITATLAMLLVYLIQTYSVELAAALAGQTQAHMLKTNRLVIPLLFPAADTPIYSTLILLLGWILDLAVLLCAGVGIVQINTTRMRTGEGLSASRILAGIRKQRFTVLFSAAGLGIIAAFFSGLVTLLWLIKSIPGVGFVLFILLSPLTLACGLFLLGTLFVICFSLPSLPAVTVLWRGDAFAVIAQAYSLVLGHPLKLLSATLLNLLETILAIAVGSVILGILLSGLYLVLTRDWLLGIRFAIAAQAGFLTVFPCGTNLSFEPTLYARVIALLLKFLSLAVLGYGFATLVIARMFSFVKLKQKTNGLNLLES